MGVFFSSANRAGWDSDPDGVCMWLGRHCLALIPCKMLNLWLVSPHLSLCLPNPLIPPVLKIPAACTAAI